VTNSISDETAVIPGLADDQADSLAGELAAAAPRRWWNRGTLVLGVVALLLAGFLGGIQVQKHYGTTNATAGRAGAGAAGGGTGRFAGGQAGYPGFGGAGRGGATAAPAPAAGAAGTTGTVKLVDGTTLYVQTADGTVVTVRTSGNTAVRSAAKSSLKALKAGQAVTVAGAADAEGTVTATSVTATQK
jgi:hypothetical protein